MLHVTCTQWTDGFCALGLFGGQPSPGICQRCDRYQSIQGAVCRLIDAGTGEAIVDLLKWYSASSSFSSRRRICIERLFEEWDEVWRTKLVHAAVKKSLTAIWVPSDLYREALAHRRG